MRYPWNYKRLMVMAALSALAGCAPSGFTPRSDFELALLPQGECTDCRQLLRVVGQRRIPIPVQPAFAGAADVRGIRASSAEGGYIEIRFDAASADRIRSVTARSRGRLLAWVAGGQVIGVSRVGGKISDGLRLSGLGEREQARVLSAITEQEH